MRTTLTLEPDVAIRLKKRMAEKKASLKETINDLLRKGLDAPEVKEYKFKVKPFRGGLAPGIDPTRLNQLVDELEVEEFLRKHKSQ